MSFAESTVIAVRVLFLMSGAALFFSIFIEKYRRSVMLVVMFIISYILFLAVNMLFKGYVMNVADVIIIFMLSGYALVMIRGKIKQEEEKSATAKSE